MENLEIHGILKLPFYRPGKSWKLSVCHERSWQLSSWHKICSAVLFYSFVNEKARRKIIGSQNGSS